MKLGAPAASDGAETLADWLELKALASSERLGSIQDLARQIARSGSVEAIFEQDASDDEDDASFVDVGGEKGMAVAEDAFAEIEERLRACVSIGRISTYPFSVSQGHIRPVGGAEGSLYAFLLMLSRFGAGRAVKGLNATQLFEDLAATSLQTYLGGEDRYARSVVFGFPRRVLPTGFRRAVDNLCTKLGEGGGARSVPRSRDQKDASLDVVAWCEFADGREGKLIAFGQCATGGNWQGKLTELLPGNFCKLWLRETLKVDPVRAFFVPFRIERLLWEEACVKGGLLFDRCRIASLSGGASVTLIAECAKWTSLTLKRLR